jgi:hypothetical protein
MELKDLLLKTTAAGKWIALRESGGQYTLTLDLPGGRRQMVHVASRNEGGSPMARLWTKVAAAKDLSGARPMSALKMNANLAFGAFAVEGEELVLVDTFLLAESTPEHLLQSLKYLGQMADQMEKSLGLEDRR